MKTVLVAVKMILFIVITVSIGSVLGTIGYLASIKNFPPVIIQPTIAPTITPAPNIDISDWNTYKNEKYGYEVKYPKDWELKDFGKNGKIEIGKKLPEINLLGGHDYGLISIEAIDVINFDSLEQWVDQNYSVNESQHLRFKKEIKIDNRFGIYREIINSVAGGYQNDAYIPFNNKIFRIKIDIYIANAEVQEKYKEILDSMLNNLKFID